MKIRKGDIITVEARNDFEVTGRVVRIDNEEGYRTVTFDVDGMAYKVGTGGHLGDTWTDGQHGRCFVSVKAGAR
jgi:hypothetical protein